MLLASVPLFGKLEDAYPLERPACGAAGEEEQRRRDSFARHCVQAKAGLQTVCIITMTLLPFRGKDLLLDMASPAPGLATINVLFWYTALVAYFLRAWLVSRSGRSARARSDADERAELILCVLMQLIWVVSGQLNFMLSPNARWLTPTTCMLLLINVPPSYFLAAFIPANTGVCFAVQYWMNGASASTAACQSLLQAAAVVFVVLVLDHNEESRHRARLAEAREHVAGLRSRLRTEAQRASLRGLLDSVFDASCMLDPRGRIVSSTPHLDAILLGRTGAGGLAGHTLHEFASSEAERARVDQFLHEVAGCSAARRVHLSLRRGRATDERVEVTLTGIAMPGDGAGAAAAEKVLFLGLQVSSSLLLETEAAADPPPAAAVQQPPPALLLQRPCWPEASACSPRSSSHASSWPAELPGHGPGLQQVPGPCCPASAAPAAYEEDAEAPDCLPASMRVQVGGSGSSVALDSVKLGQTVLCFDHITGGVKHVEVVDVRVHQAAGPRMVAVTLEDGTELQTTADHPLLPDGGAGARDVVRAADLLPSEHSLQVLRVAPQRVVSVRQLPEASEPVALVSLSVRQPQRYSVLASPGGAAEAGRASVAVASAAALDFAGALCHAPQVRNTFIDLAEHPAETKKRPASEPGITCFAGGAAGSPCHPALAEAVAGARVQRTLSSRASTASYCSSVASRHTQGSACATVVLWRGAEDRRVREWAPATSVQLSDVLSCQSRGLKSVGSAGHDAGWCFPCLMESWSANGAPCRFGLACSRCHESHGRAQFKKARLGKKSQLR